MAMHEKEGVQFFSERHIHRNEGVKPHPLSFSEASGVQLFQCPRSPDLSEIEHVSDMMGKRKKVAKFTAPPKT